MKKSHTYTPVPCQDLDDQLQDSNDQLNEACGRLALILPAGMKTPDDAAMIRLFADLADENKKINSSKNLRIGVASVILGALGATSYLPTAIEGTREASLFDKLNRRVGTVGTNFYLIVFFAGVYFCGLNQQISPKIRRFNIQPEGWSWTKHLVITTMSGIASIPFVWLSKESKFLPFPVSLSVQTGVFYTQNQLAVKAAYEQIVEHNPDSATKIARQIRAEMARRIANFAACCKHQDQLDEANQQKIDDIALVFGANPSKERAFFVFEAILFDPLFDNPHYTFELGSLLKSLLSIAIALTVISNIGYLDDTEKDFEKQTESVWEGWACATPAILVFCGLAAMLTVDFIATSAQKISNVAYHDLSPWQGEGSIINKIAQTPNFALREFYSLAMVYFFKVATLLIAACSYFAMFSYETSLVLQIHAEGHWPWKLFMQYHRELWRTKVIVTAEIFNIYAAPFVIAGVLGFYLIYQKSDCPNHLPSNLQALLNTLDSTLSELAHAGTAPTLALLCGLFGLPLCGSDEEAESLLGKFNEKNYENQSAYKLLHAFLVKSPTRESSSNDELTNEESLKTYNAAKIMLQARPQTLEVADSGPDNSQNWFSHSSRRLKNLFCWEENNDVTRLLDESRPSESYGATDRNPQSTL